VDPQANESSSSSQRSALWVSTSYFAEGFPYMVVNELAVPLFKHLGASVGTIGLTALFHLPWNLKFLWGHTVDRYETKRRWMIAAEIAITAVMIGFAFIASSAHLLGVISAVFTLLAVLSATHDIAVDGFYLEALDEEGQSKLVGLRAMAYRLAMLSIAGPGLILIGRFGWTASLIAMSAIMAALVLAHTVLLPRTEKRREPLSLGRLAIIVGLLAAAGVAAYRFLAKATWVSFDDVLPWLGRINIVLLIALFVIVAFPRAIQRRLARSDSHFGRAIQSFVAQPRISAILAFILLFRVGESLLIKMKLPFLMDEVGLTLESYGVANGTVGLVASISGTMAGGWLISKHGLRRWIWPFVLGQNILNLLYVGLSYAAGAGIGLGAATVVIAFERVGEGLGTAVFMVYLMRCCSPKHKAAHMAIATALMSVGYTLAGAYSGYIVEATSFRTFFLLSFAATIPAMLIMPFLPHLDGREGERAA
jgi:PAT family beta-lactamase induction signal transducer AmpG